MAEVGHRLGRGRGAYDFAHKIYNCHLLGSPNSRAVPLFKSKTGYYEILQVMPSATQAQIKTAYYKQSFVYHPDRNAGSEEATVRFSDISEAYTVLGNETLRKKYDRGLLGQSDLLATVRPSSSKDGAGGGSAQQQAGGRRSVGGEGPRADDFDKFFRSHYNEQLQRQRDIRARREQRLREKAAAKDGQKLDWMMEILCHWVLSRHCATHADRSRCSGCFTACHCNSSTPLAFIKSPV
uniref:J domain-containing protein n=1 Tax=Scophthalmus maximus TaxID=52904 RepID=A0A8D3BFX1_SCOMX